ncbi:MAG: calcium-binding protein [Rubrobacteraceae bacterium]
MIADGWIVISRGGSITLPFSRIYTKKRNWRGPGSVDGTPEPDDQEKDDRKATLLIKHTSIAMILAIFAFALMATVAMAAVIRGTNGNDILAGTNARDVIKGGGNDRIKGLGGNDTIYGQAGSDTIYGQAGSDVLYGGPGADLIGGSDGNDTIYGNTSNDELRGSGGNDTIRAAGDAGTDHVYCDSGTDTAYVSANDFVDGVKALTLTVSSVTSCETIYVDGIKLPI